LNIPLPASVPVACTSTFEKNFDLRMDDLTNKSSALLMN